MTDRNDMISFYAPRDSKSPLLITSNEKVAELAGILLTAECISVDHNRVARRANGPDGWLLRERECEARALLLAPHTLSDELTYSGLTR